MKKIALDDLGEIFAKELNIRADIVPVIDEGDEDLLLNDNTIEEEMPVLPVMDQVLLPGVILPIAASRERSRHLLDDIKGTNRHILVFTQCNKAEDPTVYDMYHVGVVAKVLKVFEFKKDITIAVLQGVARCHSLVIHRAFPYMLGHVVIAPESDAGMHTPAFKRKVKRLRSQYSDLLRMRMPDDEMGSMVSGIGSDKIFINFAASHMELDAHEKYKFLACESYTERVDKMLAQMGTLKGLEELRREIDDKTRDVIGKQQREYYLRHQMDVIQEELGGPTEGVMSNSEYEELAKRAEKMQWSSAVKEVFDKELNKMSRIPQMSPDYSMQLNYLEMMLDLPWDKVVEESFDLGAARGILDADHYGIDKVKDRIIEYLAVMKRQEERGVARKAQVLCLVGPPGTGKTSVCRSIAAAMHRPYRRVALGGLHDEAEIRGHRRTYIGAMPGRIIQELAKAGASNPVFVLDEVDKVQRNNFTGDPSSALLEVLDPEQNCRFHDNYLGVDYDLSRVFFIATANNISDIQPALLDRMEVIDFSGYVLEEKEQIAQRHLLPRIMKENALDRRSFKLDNANLDVVINDYTREGGVRQLEKQLSKLVRHRIVEIEQGARPKSGVTPDEIKKVLGLPIHNSSVAQRMPREGVVTGLAWTPVGGEILFIESSLSKGKGTLTMTGNLGDVMKESTTLAFEYLKSNAKELGVNESTISSSNIHIHVPEGATPKDGPSAGITIFIAMLSAFTHSEVRPNVAMTGEITLRGDVTPVGGIKEKVLAAKRAGITDIILCSDNRRDVEEINASYISGLNFHYIDTISQAIPLAIIAKRGKTTVAKRKTTTSARKTAKNLLLLLFVLASFLSPLKAQQSAFSATQQKMALLPGEVGNVSIVDGNLYCYASEVLLLAQRSGEQLLGFWADTTFVRLADNIEYVVRHPGTGDLYFTQRNKHGVSYLYCYRHPEGKKGRVKKVRMGSMSVEHPTFTTDGRIMIFSSQDSRRSFGGYDLWYSVYEDGRWSRPTNLGNRINTEYDEVTPSIYRDCLLFSSNGQDADHAYLNIYSTRLISDRVTGDTIGMLQIGRCRVQKLPEPLNSPDADDFDMVVDTARNYGYWVSKRVESDSDSQLYSFTGGLDGVLLWGRVLDKYDTPLQGVNVVAAQNGVPLCTTVTDSDGFYHLYLQSEQYYELTFALHGYFVSYESVNTAKSDDEFLIAEQRLDVAIDKLLLDQRIYYSDLFGPNVDLELSDYGKTQLEPLVRFLTDNPDIEVSLSLTNDITDDAAFNRHLTDHRLHTLQGYLYSILPPTVSLKLDNACAGPSGCSSATGLSRLVVVLHDPATKE